MARSASFSGVSSERALDSLSRSVTTVPLFLFILMHCYEAKSMFVFTPRSTVPNLGTADPVSGAQPRLVGTQTKTQGPSTARDFSLRYKSRFARDDSMVWGINDRGGAGIGDGVGID